MMFCGRLAWTSVVAISCCLAWVYMYRNAIKTTYTGIYQGNESAQMLYRSHSNNSDYIADETDDAANRRTQHQRLDNIERVCLNISSVNGRLRTTGQVDKFHNVPEYNFSYVKVPKVGCTFATQMEAVLKLGIAQARSFFDIARSRVHTSLINHSNRGTTTQRIVMFSRNPYSRLYSAYVDKIYLPLKYSVARAISNTMNSDKVPQMNDGRHVSAENVTFHQFLKQIITYVSLHRSLDDHWAPITSLYNSCDYRNFFLVKQETYAHDMEYLLRELNVEDDKYNFIVGMLHEHRLETTIQSIVKTVLNACQYGTTIYEQLTPRGCVKRLWVSFQIQGYVSDTAKFPVNMFQTSSQQRNATYVIKTVLDATALSPLTSEESKLQRQRALAKAYSEVDESTLSRITEIYSPDFRVFGYNIEQPSL